MSEITNATTETNASVETNAAIETKDTETKWREGLAAIVAEPRNVAVVRRFVRFAVALAAMPPIVYFVVNYTLRNIVPKEALQGLPRALSPTIIAGIAAVLAVNIITASFALIAVAERPLSSTSASAADERPKED